MSINKIIGTRISSTLESSQNLRPGQIVEGKILHLYPNNKAQIQLGMQKMIAQLEVNLLIGEKYHFQVQSSGDVIPLRVIGEPLKSQTKANGISLLKHLGLKTTKANVAIMQQLLDGKISFSKAQLMDAFQLLDGEKNKVKAQSVLLEMFTRKLPITPSVFEALLTVETTKLNESMKTLLHQLKQNNTHPELVKQLSQMIEKPTDLMASLVKQVNLNKQQLFPLFKTLGMIDRNVDLETWDTAWKSLSEGMGQVNANQGNPASKQLIDLELPFQLNLTTILQSLKQVNMNPTSLAPQAERLLQTWGGKLNSVISTNSTLSANDFTILKQELVQALQPLLGKETGQVIIGLENNPIQLGQTRSLLQLLSNQQTYMKLEEIITAINMDQAFLSSSPKQQFQQQVMQALLFTGLSYENQLANDQVQQQPTLKEMLIQRLQSSEGQQQENSSKLLHYINGMQINSVQESSNFIQASIQIPAERIGLNRDIELEFESRKTENGEINPEFCRILFYLDLAKLRETVIDMNIQKRSISITVFNDFDQLKVQVERLQSLLKKGLESLNYHLSSVTVKPLTEKEQIKPNKFKHNTMSSFQGVDYRI
ncbi:hypothetical protein CWR48_07025 [Oceanobacillus arenosus]|uniref:Flagellar hook-length control protein-like C-terminal domain-containing protein n=1 Tax=Oceanobacillus arenosus TaxID=1229153 RepID=A0A3D8PVZ1_9BACI|nr:hypothetical protein [Oceanobacillus arenosus]RDW19471.1 hypothetical protein CWR48_07025 [Oceanobacillus arenosus]